MVRTTCRSSEVVACSSAGFESIDVAALSERGIRLTNTSDALYDDVADTALLLTLAARRDLVRAHAYVASGDWERNGMYPLQSSVKGKTVGIVGMGTIGKAIARRCEPMGVEIAYYARGDKALPLAVRAGSGVAGPGVGHPDRRGPRRA